MITRATLSSVLQNLPKYRSMLAGNAAYSPPAFESIATATGTGSSETITFSSIPSTYKHLQLRILAQQNVGTQMYVIMNSDTGSNYARQRFRGDGSTVAVLSQSAMSGLIEVGVTGDSSTYSSNMLGATIIDIQDYASTSVAKPFRSLTGFDVDSAGRCEINSLLWYGTSAINTITITTGTTGRYWSATSVFSLYGIKG